MRQEKDNRTMELGPLDKRARGRPPKQEALSAAERARRYRERQKALRVATGEINRDVTENKAADVMSQLVRLQMRLDQEHHLNVELQTELATVRQQQNAAKKPAATPLASEVAKLRRTVAEQEKVISAYSAEINKLRDELKPSRGR